MIHASQSSSSLMEQRLAESCDLLVVATPPSLDAATCADNVASLVAKVATLDSTGVAQSSTDGSEPMVMHQATLRGALPTNSNCLYVVIHIAAVEVALRVKARLDVLRSIAGFEMLDAIAWVDRAAVEAHCAACTRTSVVALDLQPTRLESQLNARRCANRKRTLEEDAASRAAVNAVDSLPCLVLYLPKCTSTDDVELAEHARSTQSLLLHLEHIAAERSLPVVHHYLDGAKHRFFLQAATEVDASNIRDLFISLAKKDGSPMLPEFQSMNAVSAATLKLCSLADMQVAMQGTPSS